MPGLLSGDPKTKDRLAGVVLLSGTYNTDALPQNDPVAAVLAQYWGAFEATKMNSPQALLEGAPDDMMGWLPEILMLEAENEPNWLVVGAESFHEKLAQMMRKKQVTKTVE
ncbi:hypothetical protein APHAL10511_007503 [Amanita phalloides]|nr:hypothetical protein APHAL10511_007503 [Amanita phalloides]